MKIKYFYQQILSHISVIVIAFLLLAILFTQFVETYIYEEKADELRTYGETILTDLRHAPHRQNETLEEFGHVLQNRHIHFTLFNEASTIIYSVDGRRPNIQLEDDEWQRVTEGEVVVVKQDYEHFSEGATFVLLPYIQNGQFLGGILLAAPISGLSKAISEMNAALWKSSLIAALVVLLLSYVLAKLHVRRINQLKQATSKVAEGNYQVRLPETKFDEIGELSGDFNEMVRQLKRSYEEIEALENRRRQFMADVSHELKTPLTTIRGMIEGLEQDMIPESEKKRALQLAERETKRLIRLVNENLDYEKIRSNQIKLHFTEVNVSEMLEIVKDQLSQQAAEKNNDLLVTAPKDLSLSVDYDRMMQVLINIVKNSIQFTESGTITLNGYEAGDSIILEVIDDGIGMDEVEVEQIWERFYKAGVSRTESSFGEFGLGLSIVKELVSLLGGHITVESEPGQGTRFTISFPKTA
ncbi:MAG TPA: HAMP domain-containing sensor histidine kinase [Pseudogracilibacillus sp.]|nr:HAMP domain-containing sensor histidine kinase [Pseudogracilibacillus sp.]